MKIATRQDKFSFWTILFLVWMPLFLLQAQNEKPPISEVWLNNAFPIRHVNPDSAIRLAQNALEQSLIEGDTGKAIQMLAVEANILGHQAYYKGSYDKLWKALLLADEKGLEEIKANLYIHLGRYYGFFKRTEKTFEFYDISLDILRKLVREGKIDKSRLVKNYYARCATYREVEELQLGKTYLDSCFIFHNAETSTIAYEFLLFEKACVLQTEEKHQEALNIYEEILPWIKKNNPAYQVLIYYYMGDTFLTKANYAESATYFNNALEISEKYKSHLDFSPLVYEKLSELYYKQKDYLKAFNMLKKVSELDKVYFDSRSKNNRPLLEIQDAFRMNQEAQENLEKEQRLIQLENEEKVLFLQKTILTIFLIFLALVGAIYLYQIRSKHRAEKQLIQKERELELKNTNEIVELKNKELATFTLKLIEKDEMLLQLKKNIEAFKGDVNQDQLKKVARSISVSNEQNWEEFEARFVAVNQRFYNRLSELHPKLTQGDKKLCALIKLNFSSKDIAKLLTISTESVHTARYRLRKKMHLAKDENLSEFIASV